jgi:hypothetical protein
MAVVMTLAIFWDTAPCSPNVNQCFGGMYHAHLQGRKSAEPDVSVMMGVIHSSETSVHIWTTECGNINWSCYFGKKNVTFLTFTRSFTWKNPFLRWEHPSDVFQYISRSFTCENIASRLHM